MKGGLGDRVHIDAVAHISHIGDGRAIVAGHRSGWDGVGWRACLQTNRCAKAGQYLGKGQKSQHYKTAEPYERES